MAISQTAIDEVLRYVLRRFHARQDRNASQNVSPQPFILGLSGMQGSGKSTWAKSLAETLQTQHKLKVALLSLDDLYHTHESLVKIRKDNCTNDLFRNRGQPGTHDEILAESFFTALLAGEDVKIPSFDKSRFNGEGDRAPVEEWESLTGAPPVDLLIFEGWCVGFQSLPEKVLEQKWTASTQVNADMLSQDELSTMVMRRHPIEHLQAINKNLRRYNETFLNPDKFDYFIHLDTEKLSNVYRWRIQQEEVLRAQKGSGMTDEQVIAFVQVYMPAYELYLDRLRDEPFVPASTAVEGQGTQLRVLLDKKRIVDSINEF